MLSLQRPAEDRFDQRDAFVREPRADALEEAIFYNEVMVSGTVRRGKPWPETYLLLHHWCRSAPSWSSNGAYRFDPTTASRARKGLRVPKR